MKIRSGKIAPFLNAFLIIMLVVSDVLIFREKYSEAGKIYNILIIILIFVGIAYYLSANKRLKDMKEVYEFLNDKELLEAYYASALTKEIPKKAQEIATLIKDIAYNNSNMQILQKQIEYSALQNQINPHFLYNTLESIRGQALMNDQEEIAEMTEKLSKYFRYCISSRGDFVRIFDEIQNVKDYFFIMKYRFEDRFQMTIDIEDEQVLQYYIPKMTFQPIVENAIFHGLEQIIEEGNIKIRIYSTEKKICIIVQDNGVGMDEVTLAKLIKKISGEFAANEAVSARSGIALTNVNARLKLYFGEAYGITIHSTINCGTDIVITIPILDDGDRAKYQLS